MERIGHYRIVSELGRGGMGVVYKAHEESLNRFVAIKVLGEHLEHETEYVERFLREAQSVAALNHPNIVQIYAVAEDEGHHYFAMEFVKGTNVQRMIQTRGKIPPVEAVRLLLQAAAGLEEAHAHGIIHRDIKPANLMVTDRGLVKIADFGLALMGGVTSRLTATGMLMGTPGYLSPEQCLDQVADHRTDIYSLGVTFFEMLTGTMPFRADSPLALLKLIVEVEPPDVRELNPEVDEGLRDIVARMLAKDRDLRTSSCTELIAALETWLEARGERPGTTAGRVGPGADAAAGPPPPPPPNEDLNTEPTVVVPSGAAMPPGAAPLPPPMAAAPSGPEPIGTVPAARATAPASQPQPAPRRSGPLLIVAAVVLFLLAAASVTAFLVHKSGIVGRLLARGDAPPATTAIAEPDTEVDGAATGPGGTVETTMPPAPSGADRSDGEPEGTARGESPSRASSATASTSPEPDRGAQDEAGMSPRSAARPDTATSGAAASTAPEPAEAAMPQEVLPPATGTVVVAVGERLLAGEAEAYVKGRLAAAGVELIELTTIPGFESLFNPEQRPAPEEVRDALRPYARYLVPVRVEYLGERPIMYMGQRDLVYQARVSLGLMDLAEGRIVGRPKIETVEYTQLSAERVVADQLRRPVTALVQSLPRR